MCNLNKLLILLLFFIMLECFRINIFFPQFIASLLKSARVQWLPIRENFFILTVFKTKPWKNIF